MAYKSNDDEMRRIAEVFAVGGAFSPQRLEEINRVMQQASFSSKTAADIIARQQEERQKTFQSMLVSSNRWAENQKQISESFKAKQQQQAEQMRKLIFNPRLDLAKIAETYNARSTDQLIKQITVASAALERSLKHAEFKFGQVGLVDQSYELASRLLQPQRTFVEFVEHTTQRLESANDEQEISALESSLYLAETQLIAASETNTDITVVSSDEDEISDVRLLMLPFVQQEELLSLPSHAKRSSSGSLHSVPAEHIAASGRKIVQLVTQCNEAAKLSNNKEIFKPTTRLIIATNDIPWLVARDRNSFADFVDCLYFIFYEGAGRDNLRFLSESPGGVLSPDDPECNLIWCIKHLRNKWTRHDADHGKEGEIRKSWKSLQEKFDWLGLTHYPITEEHFRNLHLQLLNKSVQFLETVANKLTER